MIVVPAGLRRFVTPTGVQSRPDFVPPRSKAPPPGESCEMCGTALVDEHSHVVNLDSRRLLCACRPCYLLFTREGAGRGNYRAVPDRYLFEADVALSDALWDRLYQYFSEPELVELGCFIALTMGQQSWLRLLDIEHHEVLPGTAASMAPGFGSSQEFAASKASPDYWAPAQPG